MGEPHTEKRLTRQQMRALLAQGGLFVRNSYDFDAVGPTGFWYVIKDQFGGMAELSSRVRNKIRKSQNVLTLEKSIKKQCCNMLMLSMPERVVTIR